MKGEVRLKDSKEGAQGSLSLSYFHFTWYNLEYIQRFKDSHPYSREGRLQISAFPLEPHNTQHSSSPSALTSQYCQHSQWAFFFPSITQSASIKPNMQAGTDTGRLMYIPRNETIHEQHKPLSFHIKMKKITPDFIWFSILLLLQVIIDKQQAEGGKRWVLW